MFLDPSLDLHQRLVRVLDVRSGMHVLDLGCGAGASLPAIFAALGDRGTIVAADRDQKSLAAVQAQFSGMGRVDCKNVELSDGALPFDDNCFDRILCQNVIECVADRVGLLNECHRILKPAGRLLVSHHDFDTAVFNSAFVGLTRRLVQHFADTTQQWQDVSDGQMGRKIAGLFAASRFGMSVAHGTLAMDEYHFAPETYGHRFSGWVCDIAAQSEFVETDLVRKWQQDLRDKADENAYYFSICLMTAVGQKT